MLQHDPLPDATSIGRATPSEALQISDVLKALDTENFCFSEQKKVEECIANGTAFVMRKGQSVLAAMLLNYEEEACEVYVIASREPGGGKALIQLATEECRAKMIPKIWCWSLERYGALGFWRKMGFDEELLLKKQSFGENCYIFGKTIE